MDDRLRYASKRLEEALDNCLEHDVTYWQGYRDGVLGMLRDFRENVGKKDDDKK